MNDVTLVLLTLLVAVLIYLWTLSRPVANYWKEKGVPSIPFYLGLVLTFIGGVAYSDGGKSLHKLYRNSKLVGGYILFTPLLFVLDPEIIERILVKDFSHFVDHDEEKYDKGTLLNLGLFSFTGNEWRVLRNKLTLTFTSGKLKLMFDEINTCANRLIDRIQQKENESVDMVDEFGSYAIDVSASTIFGIDLQNEQLRTEYKSWASKLFLMNKLKFLSLLFSIQFPKLAKKIGYQLIDKEVEDYFRQLITNTFEQRLGGKFHRNDYVQLLLKLKEKGSLEFKQRENDSGDEHLSTEDVPYRLELTDDILSAQAFQFLIGGFEPLLNAMNFLLYELSQNKEIQNKVRQELKESIERNGALNYKALKDMVYLEQCVKETLRIYPIVTSLQRICTKDYAITETVTIEKGTKLSISLQGLHMDPEYFPNPEKFDPDRFGPDANINNFAYLPFGAGPRLCIGMRFAMVELKLAFAELIAKFSITLSPKSSRPLDMDPKSFFLSAQNSYFIFEDLEKTSAL